MSMSKHAILTTAIVAAIAATIAFFPSFESEAASGRRVVIEIRGFEFVAETPAVKPGDVIVWVNKDIVAHTATAKDGSWDSDLIKSGGEWQMVVEDDTFQAYFCRFHPSMIAHLNIEPTTGKPDQ